MYVCVEECMHVKSLKSRGQGQVSSIFLYLSLIKILEHTISTTLAGQYASKTHTSVPQNWEYRHIHTPTCTFYVVALELIYSSHGCTAKTYFTEACHSSKDSSFLSRQLFLVLLYLRMFQKALD